MVLFVLAVALPAAVLVFLVTSDFFGAWSGQAVSTRPPRGDDPATFAVLIVTDDGRRLERDWPADVVRTLGLPVDAMAIPPTKIEPERPRTSKSRFALHFLVAPPKADGSRIVPTTSPRSFGLALLVLLVSIAVRNMMVSGSPIAVQPRGVYLPPAQAAPGQVASKRSSRGRKGPPPPRPRKGVGRR